jgi:hypothetical protein
MTKDQYLAPLPWRVGSDEEASSYWTDAAVVIDAAGGVVAVLSRGYEGDSNGDICPSYTNARTIVEAVNQNAAKTQRGASNDHLQCLKALRVREIRWGLAIANKDREDWDANIAAFDAAIAALEGLPDETTDRLVKGFQTVMGRLADLLDADQFNNIEALAREAGLPYPDECSSVEPSAPVWKRMCDEAPVSDRRWIWWDYGNGGKPVLHRAEDFGREDGGYWAEVIPPIRATAPRRHSLECDCHDCHYAKKHPQVKPHHALCGCFECSRSSEKATRPLPDHLKAPVNAGDPCPTFDAAIHEVHKGKCLYCGAPMAQVEAIAPQTPEQVRAYAMAHDDPGLFNSAAKASACTCRCHSSAGTDNGRCIYCGHTPENGDG